MSYIDPSIQQDRPEWADTVVSWGPASDTHFWLHIATKGGAQCVALPENRARALLVSLGQWLAENDRAATSSSEASPPCAS